MSDIGLAFKPIPGGVRAYVIEVDAAGERNEVCNISYTREQAAHVASALLGAMGGGG